jgi:hypothetical protein
MLLRQGISDWDITTAELDCGQSRQLGRPGDFDTVHCEAVWSSQGR